MPPGELATRYAHAYAEIDTIVVDRAARQRRDLEVSDLKESIALNGLMNPLVVQSRSDGTYKLIAGERRLTACRELGWTRVPICYLSDLAPDEAQILELEENVKRENLTWQEQTIAIASLHKMYLARDPGWTQMETARKLGVKQPWIARNVIVHAEWANPKISEAKTFGEAYNILARREARLQSDSIDDLLGLTEPDEFEGEAKADPDGIAEVIQAWKPFEGGGANAPMPSDRGQPAPLTAATPATASLRAARPTPAPSIIPLSFHTFAAQYTGPKFNFIHCDFPYGLNLFDGPQAGGGRHDSYSDTPDEYFALLDTLCRNTDKLVSVSAHMIFWFSEKHRDETLRVFRELAPSWVFYPYPLVWWKSDNAGIAGDVTRHPRHVYETALFGIRSGRQLVRVKSDLYSCPTDKRLHPSCKPEPMLKHFFEMCVDSNTRLLDPTCGSGSALRAAEALGASHVMGLESDPEMAERALGALNKARIMRAL